MVIYFNEDGFITGISEKKLEDKPSILVKNLPEDWYNYKVENNSLVFCEKLKKENDNEKIKIIKEKFSNEVSKYIRAVLNHFDYDDLSDLLYCKNVKIYADEANKISKWVDEVYESYEEISNSIQPDDKAIELLELLPKYKG